MDTRDNIEHYLIQMEYPFESIGYGYVDYSRYS